MLRVFISSATRINGRIQYDSDSNQVMGFSLPIDDQGMPIPLSFPARSAAEIESYFYDPETKAERQPAGLVNVTMAKPINKNIPAFCILDYSTNAKYDANDVYNRWNYIAAELNRYNIKVACFGSDSDPRYNAAMKNAFQLGVRMPHFPEWFNVHLRGDMNFIPIQDVIHIGTKLRNRLLSRTMKYGKHIISIDHLMQLLKLPKTTHKLTESIIKTKDRMNFETVLKICDTRTVELLEEHVKYSEGTVFFLNILARVLRSFLDPTLTVSERLRYIWFAVFSLRIWRRNIISSRGRTLANDFLSANAYSCIEINAHSLILYVLFLKERCLDHLFSPEILGSQSCEAIFRQIRSMCSTYSTVTNASILELILKLSKIDLLNQITHIKLKSYNFPRIGKPSRSYYSKLDRNGRDMSSAEQKLPSLIEIFEVIQLAKLEALECAEFLGVEAAGELACEIGFNPMSIRNSVGVDRTINHQGPIRENEDDILQMFRNINLIQYSKKISLDMFGEDSLYVKVRNDQNEIFYVTKHTLVWLLTKSTSKLSSDRLIRVMARR